MPCGYGYDKTACTGCGACSNICPQSCIRMVRDAEGFAYPDIDRDICISCGRCGIVCPVRNTPERQQNKTLVYKCDGESYKTQNKNAPASIFSLLSLEVLSDGGVVFGTCFNEKFEAVHSFTEEKTEIAAFTEPEYVQSRIENVYMQVYEFLTAGRPVLFSGTPCQIAGLINYLNADFDGLICVAHACGGVASERAFRQYLGSLEKAYRAKTLHVTLRQHGGILHCAACVYFDSGASYGKEFMEDAFLRGYMKGLFLRPSCHACPVKNAEGIGDIILGCANLCPRAKEAVSGKDVSFALVNTQKGERLFARVASKIECSRVQMQGMGRRSPVAVCPPEPNKNRKRFFEDIEDTNFVELVLKLTAAAKLKKTGIIFSSLYKDLKGKAAHVLRSYRLKMRILRDMAHDKKRK